MLLACLRAELKHMRW